MNNITILFSGVHGVGKGYFSNRTLREQSKYYIVTASKLISEYKNATDAGYKMTSDINGNQDILLRALWKEMEIHDTIILDGHLTLLNSERQIQKIPEEFILNVPFDGIVLLQDNPKFIVDRQRIRDNVSIDKNILEMMQNTEQEYCRYLYEKYKLPYIIIAPDATAEQFSEIFSLVGEKKCC